MISQEDEKFLTDLFAQLTDEATDEEKRQELVRNLKGMKLKQHTFYNYLPFFFLISG